MRPGKRNQLFPCYKLRTMQANHGQTELQATKNDMRITRIGKYLRKYNLDELPQFFNVLMGHMSVVGPRPNMLSQLEEYCKHIRTYQMRHAVTPGITGYAQVNGYRGETREAGTMEKRVEYDLKYVENWSFGLDMKIICQTVWNMVAARKTHTKLSLGGKFGPCIQLLSLCVKAPAPFVRLSSGNCDRGLFL